MVSAGVWDAIRTLTQIAFWRAPRQAAQPRDRDQQLLRRLLGHPFQPGDAADRV
jgi:hypothetical protein